MGKANNLLIKEKNITIACVAIVVLQSVAVVLYGLVGFFDLGWLIESLIIMALCIGLTKSYFAHIKNIMKPLIGAILMFYLIYFMRWAVDYVEHMSYRLIEGETLSCWEICITFAQILLAIMVLLININHYLINYTHHSSPKRVKYNQIILLCCVIDICVLCIAAVFLDTRTLAIISNVCCALSDIILLTLVIIVEGLLDGFRLKRETNGE